MAALFISTIFAIRNGIRISKRTSPIIAKGHRIAKILYFDK
jgi:hypothetical protein